MPQCPKPRPVLRFRPSPSIRGLGALAVLASLLTATLPSLLSCSEDRDRLEAPPTGDHVAPAAPGDLAAGPVTPASITLSWTAPGDDGMSGNASRYDIRYSTQAIDESNFSAAPAIAQPPVPAPPGSSQSVVVTGLAPGTPYTFAIKAADEVPNWSTLASTPFVATRVNAAPQIDTLIASATAAAPGRTVTLGCLASDADGDSVSYLWSTTGGVIDGEGPQATWLAPATPGLHRVFVTPVDAWGPGSPDSLTLASDDLDGTLLVQSGDGLLAFDPAGSRFTLHRSSAKVEVLGERIFLAGYRGIEEIDHQGASLGSVQANPPVSGYLTLLPDLGFAIITNDTDMIYLCGSDGAVQDSMAIPNGSVETLQNIDGVVSGNRLIVSETGNNEIFSVDLTTREASIFRAVQDGQGWLGAIDHRAGTCYICRSQRIQAFEEVGEIREICELPEGNITGIAVTERFAYVVINHTGSLFRVDLATGEYHRAATGLSYPQDIEILPVRLTR